MNLHSNTPKDYWKILNAGSKTNTSAVNLNYMFEFLKVINDLILDKNDPPKMITSYVNMTPSCVHIFFLFQIREKMYSAWCFFSNVFL